jgi:hypothetical protein
MTDFTPGPWEVSGRDDRLWIAAPHPELGSKPVAMISPMPDEYVANARLIAQAPALYEALAFAVEAVRLTREYVGEELLPALPGWTWFDACENARAVLATARGEQSARGEQ